MENGFGHSVIQVDNEPASIQLAEVAAKELGLPWRHSTTHTHQGQGAIERLHQVRSIKFDLVDRYKLKTIDDVTSTSQRHFYLGFYNMLASQSTGTWYMLTA
eukprot:2296003-Amphidinium_carterae.1